MTGQRLYLLRHAKSSWADPALADHDRPLNSRGRRAAKAIGRHLRDQGIEPELVLCSSATRARETLERIGYAAHLEHELYGAGAGALLARLREVPAAVPSVMLIGHNPGLQELALLLSHARDPVSESSRRSSRRLPSRPSRSPVPAGTRSSAAPPS